MTQSCHSQPSCSPSPAPCYQPHEANCHQPEPCAPEHGDCGQHSCDTLSLDVSLHVGLDFGGDCHGWS
jgi:hypothetical protein